MKVDDTVFSDKIELDKKENNDFAKFKNIHKQFVMKLKERKIEYTSYIQKRDSFCWDLPEIYTFKLDGHTYYKLLDYMCLYEDKSFLLKKDFNAIKINGDRIVGFWDLPNPDKRNIFVYNESDNLLIEHKSNGMQGMILKLSPDPVFSFYLNYLNELSEYLAVLEKDRILFISTKTSKYTTIKWEVKTKPSFFIFSPSFSRYSLDYSLINTMFVAYNGKDFYVFDARKSTFIKQINFKTGLEQIVPNNPIYADAYYTYIFSIILDEDYPNTKDISMNITKFLDFPIKTNPILANINSNNANQFFFGDQKTNYFNLYMLDLYINAINFYSFVIPGTISSCKRVDNTIFTFKTDKGLFVLPEIEQNTLLSLKKYKLANLKDYPYKNIFGEDNFAIKNISHIIFDYHGGPYNLSTLIKAIFTGDRSYITYIVLFYLILYAYLNFRAMSRKENNDSSDNDC